MTIEDRLSKIEREVQLNAAKRSYQQDYTNLSVKQRHIDGFVVFEGLLADLPDGTTEVQIYFATDNGTLYIWDGSAWISSITASSTTTFTNKRITKRTGTVASSATPTINTDNVDFFSITALATNITSMTTNLSGTPTEGQTLWIAITGTAARTIAWGTSFEASTVALPTTTVTTNRLDIGFVWNTVTSKWRCVAVA